MDARAMRQRAVAARVGRLATVSADGLPHAVPVCFVLVDDVAYSSVDHKPKRSPRLRRMTNVEETGRGCLLVDEYDEDWSTLWWVRLDGRARIVDDPDEQTLALTALVDKYPQYGVDPPLGPVLALDVRRCSGWAADDPAPVTPRPAHSRP